MPAYSAFALEDSIFLELAWLGAAADNGSWGRRHANILRQSHLWRSLDSGKRRWPRLVAWLALAAFAGRPSLIAQAATPAATNQSDETLISLKVLDASTGKPLSGARIMKDNEQQLGQTDAQGKVALPGDLVASGKLRVEKAGYRAFLLVTSGLSAKGTVFVGLVRLPAPEPSPLVHRPVPTKLPTTASGRLTGQQTAASGVQPAPAGRAARPADSEAQLTLPTAGIPSERSAGGERERSTELRHEPTRKATVRPTPDVLRVRQAPSSIPVAATRILPAGHSSLPVTTAAGSRTYRVKRGDTLWAIAARQLGDPLNWDMLWRANNKQIHDPHWIFPGQPLTLPKLAVAQSRSRPSVTRLVRVAAGDSLWSLAKGHLGAGARWYSIYQLNRTIIVHPDLIFVGQQLRLP
ncbi:MAG: LysM peptidoglycan-binding domain-containing protein [Cyanobacteria bacterium NC_groundwater_1444_Ag_S-0.65um_54_12]|nr:LysM peptidoglycan-binding domain-containing protein [Cyanobacteria bacterium NC_groundwater_1444_Ag_S-0.65um_54_12]